MRQVIPVFLNGNLAATAQIIPIWPDAAHNTNQAAITITPWPAPCTFLNFKVTDDLDGVTWTLYVNGAPSAITAVSASGLARDITHTVAVVAGDEVYYHRSGGTRLAASNLPLCVCIEVDTEDAFTNVYGGHMTSSRGSLGAFGSYGAGSVPPSHTISLAPMAGSIVQLVYESQFAAVQPTAGFEFTVYKTAAGTTTPVAQDGTGGTPNTQVTRMSTATGYYKDTLAVTVPFVEGDLLEVYQRVIGTISSGSTCGFGVAVKAAIANQFMICGSVQIGTDNNFTAGTDYGAVPGRWKTAEYANGGAVNRGSVTSFTLVGLQAWNGGSGYPAAPAVTLAVLKNGLPPAQQATITMVQNDIWIRDSNPAHLVQITDTDYWSTQATIASDYGVQVHWSYLAYTTLPPVPMPAGCPNPVGLLSVSGVKGCAGMVTTAPVEAG